MNNAYTYDQVSNVLGVTNSASAYASSQIVPVNANENPVMTGGSMTHEYTYDGLYRLTSGTGTFTGGNGKTASYTLNMAYDNLHNITAKRQQVEQSGIMFDGVLKSGYDLTYTYNAERPHQMATVADENYRTEGTDTQNAKLETHNYQYDANGNLVYINTAREKEDEHVEDKMHERKLLWDEENRLEAISENGYVSNYWYDASGERVVKTYGDGEGVYVQSAFAGGRTGTTDFTLYVSPYMVVRNGGSYTKHIYMGGQRIVSKLGDLDSYGEDPRRIEYAGSEAEGQKGESIMPDYKAKYQLSYEVMKARYDSLDVPYHGTDNDDYLGGTGFCCDPSVMASESEAISSRVAETEDPELYQYYYHADHLGSSSYITNLYGEVAQHVEYVPFGEVFIEERNNIWNTPYLFNGKELDEETGLYYYGARYYNPRVSQWLSVDPLAEKYPNRSPYEYTFSNPVNFIDPTGMTGEDPPQKGKGINKRAGTVLDYIFSEGVNNRAKEIRRRGFFDKNPFDEAYRADYDIFSGISSDGNINSTNSAATPHLITFVSGYKFKDERSILSNERSHLKANLNLYTSITLRDIESGKDVNFPVFVNLNVYDRDYKNEPVSMSFTERLKMSDCSKCTNSGFYIYNENNKIIATVQFMNSSAKPLTRDFIGMSKGGASSEDGPEILKNFTNILFNNVRRISEKE